MKFSMPLNKIAFLVICIVVSSCASKKDILYLQDIEQLDTLENAVDYTNNIQPNDILSIVVAAQDPIATKPFNVVSATNTDQVGTSVTYLINKEGTFNFPLLGEINAKGKSTFTLSNDLEERLKEFIVNPEVSIRIENFKITVLGSVESPGTFQIDSERITLLEAIGLAGDLNIYGKRDDILILREKDGLKTYRKIDITKADFLNSEYYYLRQNDVVIVSPNFYEVQRSASNPNNRLYISLASLAISIIVLLTR